MIDIKHKKVEIFSCDIHCLETGAPEGQPVIVLHGMKFNSAIWYELGTLAQLSGAGFYVLAVDLPVLAVHRPVPPVSRWSSKR